jgi:hypothetical protein
VFQPSQLAVCGDVDTETRPGFTVFFFPVQQSPPEHEHKESQHVDAHKASQQPSATLDVSQSSLQQSSEHEQLRLPQSIEAPPIAKPPQASGITRTITSGNTGNRNMKTPYPIITYRVKIVSLQPVDSGAKKQDITIRPKYIRNHSAKHTHIAISALHSFVVLKVPSPLFAIYSARITKPIAMKIPHNSPMYSRKPGTRTIPVYNLMRNTSSRPMLVVEV